MKALAYALITLGFLAAAFQAVRQVEGLPVPLYLVGLALGAVGVALARWHTHKTTRQADHVQAGLAELDERLARLVERTEALDRTKGEIPVGDLRKRIDAELADDLGGFADRRQTIAVRFGLQAYADVMNAFAAGERHLNRVWSASTDGYEEEAREYVGRAREELGHALASLRALSGATTAATGTPEGATT